MKNTTIAGLVFLLLLQGCATTKFQRDIVPITPSQEDSLKTALAGDSANPSFIPAINEAKPIMSEVLRLHSCWNPKMLGSSSPMSRYAVSGRTMQINVIGTRPMVLSHHPKSSCVTVSRIGHWKMPAKNAVSFETVYVSEVSGESKNVFYEFVRDMNGTWLLNTVQPVF